MAKYKDFQLTQGEYGEAAYYTDNDALILAIRNILLSRPGNFPFNPSIGMDIEQYQFDLLDKKEIDDIQSELNRQLGLYMPDLQNISISITKVESEKGLPYLGISVSSTMNGDEVKANFLLSKNEDNIIDVFNETY